MHIHIHIPYIGRILLTLLSLGSAFSFVRIALIKRSIKQRQLKQQLQDTVDNIFRNNNNKNNNI